MCVVQPKGRNSFSKGDMASAKSMYLASVRVAPEILWQTPGRMCLSKKTLYATGDRALAKCYFKFTFSYKNVFLNAALDLK